MEERKLFKGDKKNDDEPVWGTSEAIAVSDKVYAGRLQEQEAIEAKEREAEEMEETLSQPSEVRGVKRQREEDPSSFAGKKKKIISNKYLSLLSSQALLYLS